MMIDIICDHDLTIKINEIKKMDYVDLLKEECYFCIKINNKVFFEEPLFPIYEFLYAYINWDKNESFYYVTLESEDNPLISFIKAEDGWHIKSAWQKFVCSDIFSVREMIDSIEKIL